MAPRTILRLAERICLPHPALPREACYEKFDDVRTQDLKTFIDTCKQELHDREYHEHHADILIKEWDGAKKTGNLFLISCLGVLSYVAAVIQF